MKLASRLNAIQPSPTLAITALAQSLKKQGVDVIDLGVGEPDFDTPEPIKQAAISALIQGQTKYTAVDGTEELKNAIIAKFKRDNGLEYTPPQILVSCGGKQSFYNLIQALINPGDEVIIPAPYWVSYPDIVKLAGGVPVIIDTNADSRYKISTVQLQAAVSKKTRLVVFNSPSNPSGMSYTASELKALSHVLSAYPEIMVASDDMYEYISWSEEPFNNPLTVCSELYDRTIVLNGVSKAYAMTGWRIGYCAGPEWLIKGMKKIQSQSTSNPTSIAQAAAAYAIAHGREWMPEMLQAFKKRHDFVVQRLNQIKGIRCLSGDGTFYAFPDISQAIQHTKLTHDAVFCEKLLDQQGIAVVPGSAFGTENHMRLSFAADTHSLEKALDRIEQFIKDNS